MANKGKQASKQSKNFEYLSFTLVRRDLFSEYFLCLFGNKEEDWLIDGGGGGGEEVTDIIYQMEVKDEWGSETCLASKRSRTGKQNGIHQGGDKTKENKQKENIELDEEINQSTYLE